MVADCPVFFWRHLYIYDVLTLPFSESMVALCCCWELSDVFICSCILIVSTDNTWSTFSIIPSSPVMSSTAAAPATPGGRWLDDCTSSRCRSSLSKCAMTDSGLLEDRPSCDSNISSRWKTDCKWTESWLRTCDCKPSSPICHTDIQTATGWTQNTPHNAAGLEIRGLIGTRCTEKNA